MFSKFYHISSKKIDDSFVSIQKELDLIILKNMAIAQLDQVKDMFQNLRKDFDIFD